MLVDAIRRIRDVAAHPSDRPLAVATRLRAIFELLRSWSRLTTDDCAFLGRHFVYPSLVQWLLRASPECPAGQAHDRVAQSPNPEQVFCEPCEHASPWRLQATLVAAGQAGDGEARSAWAEIIWRRIVDASPNRGQWSQVTSPHRTNGLTEAWRAIVIDGIGQAVDDWNEPTGDVFDRLDQRIPPASLVKYVLKSHQLLEAWIGQQGGQHDARQQLDSAIIGLGRQMQLTYRMGWRFETAQHAARIQSLLELLDALSPPVASRLRSSLTRDYLNIDEQRQVLTRLANDVLPIRDAALPTGDPLDQPVVQDLFWQRVGASSSPEFVLHDWIQRHWQPVDSGNDAVPLWRSRP
ncbi:MAG: hypothetical protein KDB14_31975 [Planctomycetales bacterium]|nr:hypothetical protein [Planctomycetales bacterium]